MTANSFSHDADGQPFNLGFNAHGRMERDISEFLGLAKGLLADGVVSAEETALLKTWTRAHPDATCVWPCSVIASRLMKIYSDGVVSDEERFDLHELLLDLVGGKTGIVSGLDPATALPLDKPAPTNLPRESNSKDGLSCLRANSLWVREQPARTSRRSPEAGAKTL
jgi:hypothetical protein